MVIGNNTYSYTGNIPAIIWVLIVGIICIGIGLYKPDPFMFLGIIGIGLIFLFVYLAFKE